MAYTMTPWGYDVDGTLPPLIDLDQFDALTGGKWSGDERVEWLVDAASATVRNLCGWHVSPSLPCRAVLDSDGSRSLWLPTTCLTGVSAVDVDGTSCDAQWSRIGQVMPDLRVPRGLQVAVVDYVAGYDESPADLESVVAGMVVRSVAMNYGVASESAGGVSVSYATAASYGGAGVSATDADLAALAQYRVVRAHAT